MLASGEAALGTDSMTPELDAEDLGDGVRRGAFQGADASSLVEPFVSPLLDPVERLRSMIGDRQEETVEILRGWLEHKEEKV